jgi:hypothetical protein
MATGTPVSSGHGLTEAVARVAPWLAIVFLILAIPYAIWITVITFAWSGQAAGGDLATMALYLCAPFVALVAIGIGLPALFRRTMFGWTMVLLALSAITLWVTILDRQFVPIAVCVLLIVLWAQTRLQYHQP